MNVDLPEPVLPMTAMSGRDGLGRGALHLRRLFNRSAEAPSFGLVVLISVVVDPMVLAVSPTRISQSLQGNLLDGYVIILARVSTNSSPAILLGSTPSIHAGGVVSDIAAAVQDGGVSFRASYVTSVTATILKPSNGCLVMALDQYS